MESKRNGFSAREREILDRISEGASDKEIARDLCLSVNTVKWYNRQLYAKLGVEGRSRAVAKAAELGLLGEEEVPRQPISRVPNNLPAPVSSFVGREKEIEEIQDILETHRLVTLTGPGGMGKTRLALEAARDLLLDRTYPDGIFWIELASLTRPEFVGAVIVEGLNLSLPRGESAPDTLTRCLGDKRLLLVLDNFEHLLDAAPLLSQLLEAAPDLKVLVTSREELVLSGEQNYPVPPLEEHASRTLFIQRAREARPEFTPADRELLVIDQICSRLDNLPLALELAAVRLRVFILQELYDRLEDRFALLTRAPRDAPERHQTLKAAIDWSYSLLYEEEQTLFRRLAVFQGSRSIDAVQEVCCFDLKLNALDGLGSLLSKNLIRQEEGLDGEVRFYLLETLQEYARELLQESGEEEGIRRRHAEYFVKLLQAPREPILGGPEIRRIAADFTNIRLAHDWTLSHGENRKRLQINVGMIGYWPVMGHHNEGIEWIESALEIVGSAPLELQAGIYRSAAGFDMYLDLWDRSRDFYHKAINCYQKMGYLHEVGACHMFLCSTFVWDGKPVTKQVMEHFKKAEEILIEVGDNSGLSWLWEILGDYYHFIGKGKLAYEARKKSLFFARKSGNQVRLFWSTRGLARSELERGHPGSAKEILLEVFVGEMEYFKHLSLLEDTYEQLGEIELFLDQPRRAVILISIGDSLRRNKRGGLLFVKEKARNQDILDLSSTQLGEAAFKAAWEAGQAMTPEEAVAFALEGEES